MDGVINIDKPKGLTSHDVVNRVRRIMGIKKVGHTGTLDPEATGVLPILIGKATKISKYLINSDKGYLCELRLGMKTDTGDSTGKTISVHPGPLPSDAEIRKVFAGFTGKVLQVPPMHSAIKINGTPLYNLARKGIEVERKAREVTIYSLDILKIEEDLITFNVFCSKGTYIRALASDIGDTLSVGGSIISLRRTLSGRFHIEDSISLKELEENWKDGKVAKGYSTMDEALFGKSLGLT